MLGVKLTKFSQLHEVTRTSQSVSQCEQGKVIAPTYVTGYPIEKPAMKC